MHATQETIREKDLHMSVCIDPPNKRLRVDEYLGNARSIKSCLDSLAQEHQMTKVIVKAKREDIEILLANGFILEAILKGYYSGTDAFSMALYYDLERRTSENWIKEDDILNEVMKLPLSHATKELDASLELCLGTKEDAVQLAELYGEVFETYPTPMNKASYIKEVMDEGTIFYVIKKDGKVISAASAEVNQKYSNAEVTDCATLPEFRKHGFMKILIRALEQELFNRSIFCAYSLARSLSFGMTASFHQLGYTYTGRLIKNCDIYGNFEDMNVWVKNLAE